MIPKTARQWLALIIAAVLFAVDGQIEAPVLWPNVAPTAYREDEDQDADPGNCAFIPLNGPQTAALVTGVVMAVGVLWALMRLAAPGEMYY